VGIFNKLLNLISSGKKDDGHPYLIEIRPMLEKYRIKRKIQEIRKNFRIRNWHKVPHITLVYNFRPKRGVGNWDLAKIIRDVASRYNIKELKFHYDGFELTRGKRGYILAFRIKPSFKLKKFRMELYNELKPYIVESPDVVGFNTVDENKFWFHATIGYRMSEREYIQVKDTIRLIRDEYIPVYPLRIPLLKSSKIAYEYDISTDRILSRREALSKRAYSEMVRKCRKIFGVDVSNPVINSNENPIWLISDTHFDHENIIKYCGRPFTDVKEMNKCLLRNWNIVVKDSDTVYFLGDTSFGRRSKNTLYWIRRLNGKIIYIRGNHESIAIGKRYEVLKYKGYRFLLVHDPKDVKSFGGWIIHGHEHNNNLRKYPFINGEKRTINVSIEPINYKPVSLDWIISLGLEKIRRMETVLDEPEYK